MRTVALLVIGVAIRLLVISRRRPQLVANEVMAARDLEAITETAPKLGVPYQYAYRDVPYIISPSTHELNSPQDDYN